MEDGALETNKLCNASEKQNIRARLRERKCGRVRGEGGL
jgi:hypothetical protein